MRRLVLLGAITTLLVTMVSISWAGTINTTRSNTFRVTFDPTAVSPVQVAAVSKELDKIGPGGVNETTVRTLLQKKGVNSLNLLIHIIPATQRPERIPAILLLKQHADEGQAIAVSDAGCTKDGKDCSKY